MRGAYTRRSARFEFLAATLLKIHAFWNTNPPGLVNIYRRFEESLRPHLRAKESLYLELLNHENKSAKFVGNVGKYLPIDTA
jgi:iron-sulfur cluster repair protein YtfE (RIC family)